MCNCLYACTVWWLIGEVSAWRPRYERCLRPVSMKLQSSNQRGGTSGAELRLHLKLSSKPPSGHLNRRLHCIAVATALPRLPINPPASGGVAISLPAPQPVSSCPTTPGLTIKLQVCQPWACQITVSINSGGGRVERKEEGVEVDGAEGEGWDVLSWMRWVECDTVTHTRVWHIYHSRLIFFRCWHPFTPINVLLSSPFPHLSFR